MYCIHVHILKQIAHIYPKKYFLSVKKSIKNHCNNKEWDKGESVGGHEGTPAFRVAYNIEVPWFD